MAESGISEEELENVSGGAGGCFVIGGTSSGLSLCSGLGSDDTDGQFGKVNGGGVHLCYYVGIGIGMNN